MSGDEDDRATRLGRRRAAAEDMVAGTEEPVPAATRPGRRAGTTSHSEATNTRPGLRHGTDSGDETQLGRRATAPDDEGVVRFGPGVPRGPAVSPEWSARPAARVRRRRRPWIGTLVTIALAAGVIAWLLTRGAEPIQAHAAQVAAVSPPGACGAVVDVVGTITTNGRPGSITYQWTRNDGQPTDVLTQTVASGATSTDVHLHWSFSGRGRFDAVATLRVLDPGPPSEARGTFTYSCS